MGGRALQKLGGRSFPPKTTNSISHTKPTIFAPTMAAAAALVGRPSDGFAPTILHPSMSLNAYFQDIPFWNFFYAWFSAGDRQPVVLDLGALTAIDAIISR